MMDIELRLVDGIDEAIESSVRFWEETIAQSNFDFNERAKQVRFQILYQHKVIGLSTAEEVQIAYLNNNYFFNFRMLIHPDHRYPGLAGKLLLETFNYLENLYLEKKTKCIGVLALVENKRIMNHKKELFYRPSQLMFAGYSDSGREIRLRYFKGAKI